MLSQILYSVVYRCFTILPYPSATTLSLSLLMPSMPTSHPHPQSPFPVLPSPSLCVAASSARNIYPPLQVNCHSTLNNNSNVNSEINSFLGISSPYPRAELSSSLLCTPVALAFACTWHLTCCMMTKIMRYHQCHLLYTIVHVFISSTNN